MLNPTIQNQLRERFDEKFKGVFDYIALDNKNVIISGYVLETLKVPLMEFFLQEFEKLLANERGEMRKVHKKFGSDHMIRKALANGDVRRAIQIAKSVGFNQAIDKLLPPNQTLK